MSVLSSLHNQERTDQEVTFPLQVAVHDEMRIGDMTYRNQATDNSRKQKVVQFNDLKLCSVPYETDHQKENEPRVHALLKAQPLFFRNCVGIQAHHCNCGYVIVTLFTTKDTPYIIFYVNHI